ncbi:Nonselective cation channel [Rhizoctonia solani]|nr:Nonselective cation channel [Rhizoctonia solani]
MPEGLFMIYGLGFVIEKLAAMQEHGIRLWNGFDMAFVTVYFSYAGLRLYGIRWDEAWARELGIDILAVVAVIVFPRLAFVTLSNNLMVLSLRSMFTEFALDVGSRFLFRWFSVCPLDSWKRYVRTDLNSYSDAPWAKPLEQVPNFSPSGLTYYHQDASGFDRACERYHDQVRLIRLILGKLGGSSFAILRITGFPILLAISFYERQKAAAEAESMFEKVTNVAERFVTLPRRLKRMTLFEGAVGSSGNVQAIFELDDEFNPSPIIGDSLTWPCQLESSESEPPPLPSEKFKRPERPKLDTIMSASSAGEGQSISERTPRPTGSNQLGGPYHEIALENHNGAFQANSSRDQIPSSISTQLNNGFLAPIQRRNRRKSTFEPRLVPNRTEAASLSVPPANFTSPLAQLFSPIISEPPDGGFNAPNTTIGQRRTLRKSGGDQQTAPGVAMFRRRALTGMVGGAGTSSSALSTTPGEEKEPSEAVRNSTLI